MQGRGLQTFLILMSLSLCAYAQDGIGLDSSGTAEPDAATSLAPKTPAPSSGTDEFSEFEQMGLPSAPVSTPRPSLAEPSVSPTEPSPLPTAPSASPIETSVSPTPSLGPAQALQPAAAPEKKPIFHSSTPVPVQNLGGDEPDFGKEEKLHRIYQKYNTQPTSEAAWGKAMGEGKAQVYDVQSGDTLWSISQTLFGDAQYWPKVWSINNDTFPNPHEITPSTKIQFFSGGLTEAPSLAVRTEEKPIVVAPPLAKNEVNPNATPVEAATEAAPAVFPKQTRKSRILRAIPDSLPLYRLGGVNKPDAKVEVINGRKKIQEPLVSLTHYVAEGEISSVGKIIEVEHGGESASIFQYVILQISDSSEKIFHIIRDIELVKSPFIKGGPSGRMIEVEGEVEVLEKVSEDKNYYRAIVRKAIAPLKVGSLVQSGSLPMVDVIPGVPQAAIEATLIGGQYSSERQLYPRFSFVFIDAGTAGGLKEGQTLSVFANLKSRNEKTVVEFRNRLVGHIKIIKISDNFSTGYVTDVSEDLQRGDHVGGGATQSITEKANPADGSEMSLDDTSDNTSEKPAEVSPEGAAGEESLEL